MFLLKPKAFGLDISDNSLRVIAVEKKKKGFCLVSFNEEKISKGIVEKGEIKNEKKLSEIIKKAVENTKGKKIKTKYVIASLPEEKSFLDVFQMPMIEGEELEEAVKFEAENHFPMKMEEVYCDFEKVSQVKNHINYQEVLIAAAPKNIVDKYIRVVKLAGFKPLALEPKSLAISRALIKIKKGSSTGPFLIIELSKTKAIFIIYSGKSLRYTSTFPFTSELEKLVKEIGNHLDYYRSHEVKDQILYNGKNLKKILLAGSAPNLKGTADFISSSFKIKTELANPLANLLKESPKGIPKLSASKLLSYATAIGLALKENDH